MREGDILENRYQILQEIGEGGTGVIYLAWHLTLQKYIVVKKVKDHFVGTINVRGEADILKRLHHTCLPQVYDFVQIGTTVYTVMDYIEGTDLQQCMDQGMRFDEAQLIYWMRQICQVLDYLHSQNPPIYHSDIKPGNIMVTRDGNICLIDFNISLEGEDSERLIGISPWYAAPEQYEKAMVVTGQLPYKRIQLDGRMDLYSAAATFYPLMCGQLPAPNKKNTPLLLYDIPYSGGFRAILDKAMNPSPGGRYSSARAMEKALEKVEKMDPAYRRLTRLQWLAAAVYGVLGVACVLMIYYGISLSRKEAWREAWQDFYEISVSGEEDEVISQGIRLLDKQEYKSVMSQEERREILYAVGSSYYSKEDYTSAARYYGEAAEGSGRAEYYRDYAIALARSGQWDKAEQVLSTAASDVLEQTQIALVSAEIKAAQGQYEEALNHLKTVTDQSNDRELLAHAALLKADISKEQGETEQELTALREALSYDSGRTVLRKYGEALLRAAETADEQTAREYDLLALECYEELCGKAYATFEDRMNLAIAQLSLEMYRECRSGLEELALDYSDDYRVYMLLCESYLLDGVRIDQTTQEGYQMRSYYAQAKEAYQGKPVDEAMEELIRLFEYR